MATSDLPLIRDRFERDLGRGRVIGSCAVTGEERLGRDPTAAMSVDHGALRITSLRQWGWGTATLAYASREDATGTAFGVLMLNGHNTAQAEPLGEPLAVRFKRWMRGNEVEPWPRHIGRWLLHGRRRWTIRRFEHWLRIDLAARRGRLSPMDENLAVGFVPEFDSDPLQHGSTFVMHATGHDNGELWAVSGGRVQPILTGVRNVPLFLLTAFDGEDVVFYAASMSGTRSLPASPDVRPLAVLPRASLHPVHPAVMQSVSGQIGFAADTRVWETVLAMVPAWLSTAGGPAVREQHPVDDSLRMVPGGVGLARIRGRVRRQLTVEFRCTDAGESGWCLSGGGDLWTLSRFTRGESELIASAPYRGLETASETCHDVQISDDGCRIGVTVDGVLVFGWIDDPRDADEGFIRLGGDPDVVHSLVVYPRMVSLPEPLRPSMQPVRPCREGNADGGAALVDRLVDDFVGSSGELDGREIGGRRWQRTTGTGRFVLTGVGAGVDATAATPLPGRVVYTVPSPSTESVELEIDVVPPGKTRGDGERGRAGVVFEQADGDALVVATWLDDGYGGASISSFFRMNGFEDLYDAIWANVGSSVAWGRPYRLRVAFDGMVFEVYLDDELVIYRSLVDVAPQRPRLRIDRVGIVANWEWGTDTGSMFNRFVARTPADRAMAR